MINVARYFSIGLYVLIYKNFYLQFLLTRTFIAILISLSWQGDYDASLTTIKECLNLVKKNGK